MACSAAKQIPKLEFLPPLEESAWGEGAGGELLLC